MEKLKPCKDCSNLEDNSGDLMCMAGERLQRNRKKCRNFDDVNKQSKHGTQGNR